MNKQLLATATLLIALSAGARASISLFERAYNLDGAVTFDAAPAGVDESGFDTSTGLGTVSITVSGGGSHFLGLFLDHEIDEAVNTFFNEVGSTSGTPGAGQSWEIDEPEYVFGDIVTNFSAGALDGSIGTLDPDDVSMAMGWDVTLAAGQIATGVLSVSTTAPGGFYLAHSDPESDVVIYLSGTLRVIPEPSVPLFCMVAGAAAFLRRRRS